jgi:hypothetical protein
MARVQVFFEDAPGWESDDFTEHRRNWDTHEIESLDDHIEAHDNAKIARIELVGGTQLFKRLFDEAIEEWGTSYDDIFKTLGDAAESGDGRTAMFIAILDENSCDDYDDLAGIADNCEHGGCDVFVAVDQQPSSDEALRTLAQSVYELIPFEVSVAVDWGEVRVDTELLEETPDGWVAVAKQWHPDY